VSTERRADPRPALSRARLLEAATNLLRSGGPSAVTVDAVTRAANVGPGHALSPFPQRKRLAGSSFSFDDPTCTAAPRRGLVG
jgi:hypothetical protein